MSKDRFRRRLGWAIGGWAFLVLVGVLYASLPSVWARGARTAIEQAAPVSLGSPLERDEQVLVAVLGPLGSWNELDIMLNNNRDIAMEVTPVGYADGREVVGSPLVVNAGETQWLDVRALFRGPRAQLRHFEMIELRYFGYLLDLRTQIVAKKGRHLGSTDVLFTGRGEFRSPRLSGVWVVPPGGRAVVTIANSTDEAVSLRVRSSQDTRQHSVRLGPRATTTVVRQSASGRPIADALAIESDAPLGSLRAGGFLEFGARTFGIVRFYDPGAARRPMLGASNLRTHDADVQMALANTGDQPVLARIYAQPSSREAGSALELPSVSLRPGQATIVDMRRLSDLRSGRVSVRVTSNGRPGDLVGYLAAIDRQSLSAYELPLRDPGPTRQSTGNYPWRLDGDYNSIASIVNVGQTAAAFSVVITYEGGVYNVPAEILAPGATATFDVRKLRDLQVDDVGGQQLPRTAERGQFKWSIAGPVGEGRLAGRMEISSREVGQTSSYSCGQCCPDSYSQGFLQPVPVRTPTGWSTSFAVMQQQMTCSGSAAGQLYAYATNWNIGNPSVTSVSTTGWGTASANGLSGGDSYVSGEWTAYRYEPFVEDCREVQVDAGGGGQVQVKRPKSLTVDSESYVDSPPAPYDFRRIYQIRDQDGQPMQGFAPNGLFVTESYTPNPANGNCSSEQIETGQGYAEGNGTFPDNYRQGGSPPAGCSSSSVQRIYVNGTHVATINVTWTPSGVTVSAPVTP